MKTLTETERDTPTLKSPPYVYSINGFAQTAIFGNSAFSSRLSCVSWFVSVSCVYELVFVCLFFSSVLETTLFFDLCCFCLSKKEVICRVVKHHVVEVLNCILEGLSMKRKQRILFHFIVRRSLFW